MITTLGQILLNEKLPDDLKVEGPIDKKRLGALMTDIAHRYPAQYDRLANHVKDMGNHAAYELGTSVSLADFKPLAIARDAAFAAHAGELRKLRQEVVENPTLASSPDFQARRAAVFGKIEERVNQAIYRHLEAPNRLTSWVASGARGDPAAARQMLAMAGMNVDVAGNLVPGIAKRSFSEGLSPIDFHVHATGARRGVVNTYTSVREPGAFAKELNTLASDMLITAVDCGTRKGRLLNPHDPDVFDRLLAHDTPGVGHRNDVIDRAMQRAMLSRKTSLVTVRSPLTCEQSEGVCAKCFGLDEEGRLPPIGQHVGLRAASSITEPLTQLALNTKHTGGVLGAGKSPFQQIMQLMHAPREMDGAAVLAGQAGQVTAIAPAPVGGVHLTVDDHRHYLPLGLDPVVRVGDRVSLGQALSKGMAHPAEVVALRGMAEGREHFADSLRGLYAGAGIRGHGKIFETISRAVLNLGQVLDPGKEAFVPGEIVHWNAIADKASRSETEKISIHDAEGRFLAKHTGELTHFTQLAPRHLAGLRSMGINQVSVYRPGELVVRPMMLGTERAALHKGDWLANLGYRFLGQQFRENAATGASADLHGWNPMGPAAYGAEFGKGMGGRY